MNATAVSQKTRKLHNVFKTIKKSNEEPVNLVKKSCKST